MNYVFHFEEVLRYWPLLAQGVIVTLSFTLLAMFLSVVVGTAFALVAPLALPGPAMLGWCYVEAIRNTPFLVQLFILFFGLPAFGIRLNAYTAALVGLVIYNGAFATEIIRAGLQAVHHSQIEAGLSIGMSRVQVFFYVVLSPALEKVYPALSSQFVLLMLATSVISAIGVDELTSFAGHIQTINFRSDRGLSRLHRHLFRADAGAAGGRTSARVMRCFAGRRPARPRSSDDRVMGIRYFTVNDVDLPARGARWTLLLAPSPSSAAALSAGS